jgi:sulfite exporter TauE/SafE
MGEGTMSYIWIGLAGGAAAFAHCLGMCGGFALHLSRGRNRWETLGRQLLWLGGKTFTYIFLGAMAGFFGRWLSGVTIIPRIQDVLTYAAGTLLIFTGARMLNLLPWWRKASPSASADGAEGLLPSVFRRFLLQPTAGSALTLGLATGFLPCPIIVGFLALSVQSGSVMTGMAMMAALGVGTAWSLLLLGMSGHMVHRRLGKWGTVAPGVILILLGLATALRGTEAFHRILGCPPSPVQQAAPDKCPCCSDDPHP